MPVTARLSKKFYDTLGEDVAQELVDWFNQVDATYRGDLRELNELNFTRFDAKLEQRIAEVEAHLEQRMTELQANLGNRMTELEARLSQQMSNLEARVGKWIAESEARVETHMTKIEGEVADLRTEISGLEERMTALFGQANDRMEKALASQRAELIKWTFLFVVGTAVGAVGVMTRLLG